MEKVKLSVIVCTYNRKTLVSKALDSVIGQKTSFSFEVIVGDDCSTDGTRDLLLSYRNRYPEKIVLSFMTENSGIGANWATALMKARGEYVAFLDDDDYWTDNCRMQVLVDYLESHAEYDFLYTNGYTLNEHTGKYKLIVYPKVDYPDIHKMWEGKQPNVQLNMLMVRKKLIDECIKLEDYIRFRFPIQDWNTNILLLKKAHCVYMDFPSCVLRLTDESLSRSLSYDHVQRKHEKAIMMYKYIAEQFSDDPLISYNEFDEIESVKYTNHILASLAFIRGDYRKAKHYSRLAGGGSFRDKCAQTWVTFHLFRWAQMIRRKASESKEYPADNLCYQQG